MSERVDPDSMVFQGHLVDLVQRDVRALLQSALEVALEVVRANPTVLEGLGAHLEGKGGFFSPLIHCLIFL